jgi:hypothetical protein
VGGIRQESNLYPQPSGEGKQDCHFENHALIAPIKFHILHYRVNKELQFQVIIIFAKVYFVFTHIIINKTYKIA